MTRLSVIADAPMPQSTLSRLQRSLTGTCADKDLTQSLVPMLARLLADSGLRPVGFTIDHDAGKQKAVLSLNMQNGANFSRYLLPIDRVPPELVQMAELVGQPQEGQTLRLRFVAIPGADNSGIRMRWLRDGAVIDGATGMGYRLRRRDIGARISLRLESNRPDIVPVTTAAVGPVTARPVPPRLDNLRLTGRPMVGRTLTVDYNFRPGSNAAPAGRIIYQWLRGGVPIAQAGQAEYTLQNADIGQIVSIQIRAFDAKGMAAAMAETATQSEVEDLPPLAMLRPVPRPQIETPAPVETNTETKTDAVPDLTADIMLVRKHVVVGQYDEALRLTDTLLEANPGYSALHLMRSRIYMEKSEYATAQSALAELLVLPDLPEPIRRTAIALQDDIQQRAVQATQARKEQNRRLQLAADFRWGSDRNARHTPGEDRITYYLDNLAALDDLNPQAVTGPAPGAPAEGEDSDETYRQTALSVRLARWGDGGMTKRLYLSGMVVDRRYLNYDDNGDEIGDGDYQIMLARGGLRGNLVYTRHGRLFDTDVHVGVAYNSHDRDSLDYTSYDGGVMLKRRAGSRAYRLELALHKRVNARAPTRQDIEALWGLKRREDDALRLGFGFVQNVPLGPLRGQIVFDAHRQVTQSNLPRYDRTGGDIGLALRVVW